MSLINLQNGILKVSISTLGAELQSIRDQNDVERMWQGDPAFWTGRAPILFPVAGGFRDDAYELHGKRYSMPKHGIVRKLEWTVESADASSATFLINRQTEGFPFAYELRAIFTLRQNTLEVSYRVTNRDQTAFWFSVGSHEAYATPEGIEAYEIVFDAEETLENYPLIGNLIARKPILIAEKTRSLPLNYQYFAVDALVFQAPKSHGVTLRSKTHAREIRVDFPGHDTLMLWTKPDAGYICIEPWCNAPDFVDADPRIDHKPGFIELIPGATETRAHVITIR